MGAAGGFNRRSGAEKVLWKVRILPPGRENIRIFGKENLPIHNGKFLATRYTIIVPAEIELPCVHLKEPIDTSTKSNRDLRKAAKASGMRTLMDDSRLKIFKGITTPAEVAKITRSTVVTAMNS